MLTKDQIFLAARLMYQTGQMDDILGAAGGAPSCQRIPTGLPIETQNSETQQSVRLHIVYAKHKKTGEVNIMQLESITEDSEWEELT